MEDDFHRERTCQSAPPYCFTIYSGDANPWAVVAREAEVPDLPQAQDAPEANPIDIDDVLSL